MPHKSGCHETGPRPQEKGEDEDSPASGGAAGGLAQHLVQVLPEACVLREDLNKQPLIYMVDAPKIHKDEPHFDVMFVYILDASGQI